VAYLDRGYKHTETNQSRSPKVTDFSTN